MTAPSALAAPLRRLAPALVGAALLAACAPGGASSPTTVGTITPTPIETSSSSAVTAFRLTTAETAEATAVRGRPDSVYAAVVDAFSALGLPPTSLVTAERKVAYASTAAPNRLGRERLSRYLDCGTDVTGVANADSYTVRLSVVAQVAPAADSVAGGGAPATPRSTVVTLVTANARSRTSSGEVRCGTTGALEQRLLAEVRQRTGG